ncbi:MAG TPA: hypothetical protein VNN10_12100 [Dehalococcoidia bacterium]|nr:hypothetical protein [Dehalococcoidia bacterium]
MGAEELETPKEPAVWPLCVLPAAIIGGLFGALSIGGKVEDIYGDLLPFLVTTWIGMGFTYAWDMLRYTMHIEKASPVVVAATGVLTAVFMLSALGWQTLWQDPWVFGAVVWPGIQMARPVVERLLASRAGAGTPASPGSPGAST